MKRLICILMLSLLLVGCGNGDELKASNSEKNRFVCVENNVNYMIMVDRETGVMYVMSFGMYNAGTFTLMVDIDGNPLIYKGVTE